MQSVADRDDYRPAAKNERERRFRHGGCRCLSTDRFEKPCASAFTSVIMAASILLHLSSGSSQKSFCTSRPKPIEARDNDGGVRLAFAFAARLPTQCIDFAGDCGEGAR